MKLFDCSRKRNINQTIKTDYKEKTTSLKKTVLTNWGILLLLLLIGCNKGKQSVDNSKLLAKVGDKELHISELEGMIPYNATSEDSSLIINALVERWAKEAVMLNEAEKNVPEDLNIDKLVEDYRASLLKNNYESVLIEQLLDSVVTKNDLNQFYESHKAQFVLEEPIVRCYLLKTANDAPELNKARTWWNSLPNQENLQDIQRFANQHGTLSELEDSKWQEVSSLIEKMPVGFVTTSNIYTKNSFVQSKDGFTYFFHLIEVLRKDATPPLAYLSSEIKRVILHQRKQKLLQDKKAEMYARETRRNNIKFYK